MNKSSFESAISLNEIQSELGSIYVRRRFYLIFSILFASMFVGLFMTEKFWAQGPFKKTLAATLSNATATIIVILASYAFYQIFIGKAAEKKIN